MKDVVWEAANVTENTPDKESQMAMPEDIYGSLVSGNYYTRETTTWFQE